MRVFRHAGDQLGQRFPALLDDSKELQGADQAIAGRCLVENQDVARGFATYDAAAGPELFQNVAIANLGALELDTTMGQRVLQAEVAHDGADDRPLEIALLVPVHRKNVEQLVTVDQRAPLIGHHEPVTIAVERNTDIRLDSRHGQTQELRRRRPAAVVDVFAVWRAANRDYLGTQRPERPRPDFVARAVGPVEYDLQTLEIGALRHAGRAKFLVANAGRIDALCFSEALRTQRNRRVIEALFDRLFDFIRQLGAGTVEKLDAVVIIRVVGSTDHHAKICIELLRQPRDARRGQRAQQQHIGAGRDKARFERGFEHVT